MEIKKTQVAYGSWKSPVVAKEIAKGNLRLSELRWGGGAEPSIFWLEGRPAEGGRNVLVQCGVGKPGKDLLPGGVSVRTQVNEYGGGDYVVAEDGTVYFSSWEDQRLYKSNGEGPPVPITPRGQFRFADLVVDGGRNRLICVREDHSVPGKEPVTTLVAVKMEPSERDDALVPGEILAEGHDFYSSPRISPDGRRLCWLSWNHPLMPWDGTELWAAEVSQEGQLIAPHCLAGGPDESIFQPEWSLSGMLYFVSDQSGWWNHDRIGADGRRQSVWRQAADFGLPQWIFGQSSYGILDDGRLLCTWLEGGETRLGLLDPELPDLEPLPIPFTQIENLQVRNGQAIFLGASQTEMSSVVQLDLAQRTWTILRRSGEWRFEPGDLSIAESIEFPTRDGESAHGFFYRPQNRLVVGLPGELPPLLVISHGGPTSMATNELQPKIQYWTTRGWAVLDVNYRGSSGFGRAYRDRLKGRWGVLDVTDCVDGARYLAERRWIDAARMAIRGGSAGGYTTLCALTFTDQFQVGASYYGVSDLALLEVDTHKFESRYTHSLVGPYPAQADLYAERSPLQHVDRLRTPVIFFQGLEDRVVPPNQAERMVEALSAKGIRVEFRAYPGEGHGFRQAETIQDALERELIFFGEVLGFEPVP